jgi:hypothetical protein
MAILTAVDHLSSLALSLTLAVSLTLSLHDSIGHVNMAFNMNHT